MYKVNTSFVVDAQVHGQWLDIIKDKYIPLLRKEGFSNITLSRVLTAEVSSQFTYSLLIEIEGLDDYYRLSGEMFDHYTEIAVPLFGDRVGWFTTLMKVIC